MDEPVIDPHEIITEADNLLSESEQASNINHSSVLTKIVDALEPIDFRDEADLGEKEPVSKMVLLVVVVQTVLMVARQLGVGLCRYAESLYSYNGAYWQLIESAELEDFFGRAAERLGVDRIIAAYHVFRTNLIKQFLAVAYLRAPEPSAGKVLINLQNGTYEITQTKRELRDFSAEDFLPYQLPFSYDGIAVSPKWVEYLDRVLPDKSSQAVLAEFIAYIFTGLKLEKTLLLFGSGANGKSVFFEVVAALLGPENITHFSFNSLTHEYSRARLADKLLNYASEISSRLESEVFKKLTSGEPVEARLPYSPPFIMTRYAKLAVNCNELPRDVEHNEAFFRRFLIIPFEVFIPEGERNPNLAKEIISEELPGVFNWVLAGLDRLLTQGNFSPCEAAQRALANYRKESDSVAVFIDELGYQKVSCREDATPLKEIYGEYRNFCVENGHRAVSAQTFRKRLEALGFECPPKTSIGRLVYAERPGKVF
jgi:putative DNA primase/helicase